MFTPPPSPHPSGSFAISSMSPLTQESMENSSSSDDAKRNLGRRFRCAVILVPLVVVILTVCARFSPSRVTQESFRLLSCLGGGSSSKAYKRSPEPQLFDSTSQTVSSTTTSVSAASSSSRIPIASQSVPVIPSAPPTLPTPFPQPFDGSISQNFSSMTCSNFFANMTNATPFRSCRPFSLLLGSSSQFINVR